MTKTELLQIYRKLLVVRMAEERISAEYHLDEMKTPMHLGIGAEAISVGVVHCLPKNTKVFGTYRNHALYLALSDDLDGFFGELFGKNSGHARGRAGSMHLSHPDHGLILTSAVVGTTIPVAVGTAMANNYQNKKETVAVFFGDGATEEGVFWESINFACLKKLNILFICEDNDLAIHAFKKDRQSYESLERALCAFPCHFAKGNGRRVDEVIKTTKVVLEKMKETPGPGFLHLDYFRIVQHVGPGFDFDVGYRQKPTDPLEYDPLPIFEKHLSENRISNTELSQIRRELDKKISMAVENARKAPFAPADDLYLDVMMEV